MTPIRSVRRLTAHVAAHPDLDVVLRGAGVVFAIQIVGAALSYFALVLLARWIGAGQYGVYAFYISLATIIALPAGLGFPASAVRFVAQYRESGDYAGLRGFFDFGRRLTLGTSLVLMAGAAVVVVEFGLYPENSEPWIAWLALAAIPLLGLSAFYAETARAFLWALLYEGPGRVIRPLMLIVGVGGLAMIGWKCTSIEAIASAIAGLGVGLAVLHFRLRSRMPPQIRTATARIEPRHWIWVSMPLLAPRAFNAILVELDVVFVGVFLQSETVAVYQAAARTSMLIGLVFAAATSLAAPRIAALHAQRRSDALQRLLQSLVHWIFWPTLAAGVLLLIIGKWVLALFGGPFSDGYPVLAILVLSAVLNAATGPLGILLGMTGLQNVCARVFIACAVLNVVLHVSLIPAFGAPGAAMAVLLTIAVSRIWLLAEAHTKLKLFPSIFGKYLPF